MHYANEDPHKCTCTSMCVCVCVSQRETDTESGKQTDWQTGHLLVCFQTHQTLAFCGYTVFLQVWIKEGVRLPVIRERVCALPEHVEGVTCSSPCFPSLSAHLVVAMGTARQRQTLHQPPRGIVRTERRFEGEESLFCFVFLNKSQGKNLQTLCFLGLLILREVCYFLKSSAAFYNLRF